MQLVYLTAILVGISGMGIIDWRFKLALFYDWRRTLSTVGAMMVLFIAWDIAGMRFDIFFAGSSQYVTGIMFAFNVPLEEIFFLLLLSYMPLILYRKFGAR
jgi:lycopene cyclase domain-containing protein